MPRFAMRFDVDSRRCLRAGTPELMRVADRLGVRFTFFVSMGRAISRRDLALRTVRRSAAEGSGLETLPVRSKLGPWGILETLVVNPRIGVNEASTLRALAAAGHELGLHGGRNHGTWIAGAKAWPTQAIDGEISWGLSAFTACGLERPRGFSSPGWVVPPDLEDALLRAGFAYRADRHADDPPDAGERLPNLLTQITGDGGVGYLEWMRARGADSDAIVADFRTRLRAAGDRVAAYDHPFWAGASDAALVERLVSAALAEGFDVAPMEGLVAP